MEQEPVMTAEYVKSVLLAVLAVFIAFGVWHPTDDQTTAMLGVVAVVMPALQFFLVRGKVTPLAKQSRSFC